MCLKRGGESVRWLECSRGSSEPGKSSACWTATCETGSLRGTACAHVSMRLCASGVLPHPQVLLPFSAYPALRAEVSWAPDPQPEPARAVRVLLRSLPRRVAMCCTSCCLSMHSCLSCFFSGGPGARHVCQGRLLGWFRTHVTLADALGRWHHLLFSPQCSFVLNTIDTPGAFDVTIMKKWNRWVYSIFFLAIWFSANNFWGAITRKMGLFPGLSQTLQDKLFSSLPITNAKKCRKSK